MLGKKLLEAVKRTHPDLPVHLLRREGIVTTDWQHLVKVEPLPGGGEPRILWHERVAAAKEIRKDTVAAAFRDSASSFLREPVVWV